MNRLGSYAFAALFTLPLLASAAESSDTDLIKTLARSKHSLVDGIAQAEKTNGAAISAKFELEDGKLSLSVYTAKEGLDKDAEHNVLMELSGDPRAGKWQPKSEIFQDREHIARSAMQLTLMQLSKLSLKDAVKAAASEHKGTVYSAIPAEVGGRPLVEVRIAGADGKFTAVKVDLMTGKEVQ
jgi:uncharacterized membrane protein YkoI